MSHYHEPATELPEEARNFSRALNSLKEEIEAIDWYHQRVVLTQDPTLQKALAHNRDEEIEHAAMMIEWLRRNMPGWDEELRTYLFTEGDLTTLEEGEEESEENEEKSADSSSGLGIGKL